MPNRPVAASPCSIPLEPPSSVLHESRPAPLKVRLINFVAIVLPFAGLIAAIALLWGVVFNWVYLALLIGMLVPTGFGITVGYHRLFTHRSFETPRLMAFLFAVFGSMAVQGPVLEWVAVHRKHHQHSDEDDDPHSPHIHGSTFFGVLRGAWHSHVGWMFERRSRGLARYVRDLRSDPMILQANRMFPFWVIVGLLIPTLLGGLLTGTWIGLLLGFIWGGLVRVFLVHHITWSINSICHIWGSQPFGNGDHSRNNAILGFLAFGEGWHNNHHAFPASASHGLRWWEFDLSYQLIRVMSWIGLARKVRLPHPDRIRAKRADS